MAAMEGTPSLAERRIPWTRLVLACAWCKRMLDDEGVWRAARPLLRREALTHGICPDCLEKHSPSDPRDRG
jgi:hypothetical protein